MKILEAHAKPGRKRGRCTFKQEDVTRAIKGACNAGIKPKAAKIDKGGNIVLLFETPLEPAADQQSEVNDWHSI